MEETSSFNGYSAFKKKAIGKFPPKQRLKSSKGRLTEWVEHVFLWG
jgi:hypothetical protein